MANILAQFDGSIPELYDAHLGPLFFEYYGADLSLRVSAPDGGRVLELACGTGIATGIMRDALPRSVEIVATDLNDPMLDFARSKRGHLDNVTFEQADAQDLQFDAGTFDAVVCQFGLMFFPDKLAAMQQAARVLKPGGLFAFNVWDSLERNPVARATHEIIGSHFEKDPPGFMLVPFGFYELDPIKTMLARAGFSQMDISVLPTVVEYADAHNLATGLVMGNPSINELRQRASVPPEQIVARLAEQIKKEFGSAPSRIPMQAIVFTARLEGD